MYLLIETLDQKISEATELIINGCWQNTIHVHSKCILVKHSDNQLVESATF